MARIGPADAPPPAPRPEATPVGDLEARWLDLPSGPDRPPQWCALIAGAAEPNVFHEPEFLREAVPFLAPATRLLVVADAAGLWHGVLPLTRARAGLVMPVTRGFTHQYGPLGTPHLGGDCAAVWRAVLDRLAADGAAALVLPHLRAEGPVHQGLLAATAATGRPVAAIDAWRRPVLVADGAAPVCKVSMKRWRRLNRDHAVHHEIIADPARLMPALEEFLALEQAGWKGRAGTALASHPDSLAFARGVVGLYGARGGIVIDRLSVDGRPVAMHIGLAGGGEASMWKIAYDETLAAYSVGRQLLWQISTRLHRSRAHARIDSLAMDDGGALADMWPERLAMADLVVACRPGGGPGFAAACLDARAWRGTRAFARRLRDRLRR